MKHSPLTASEYFAMLKSSLVPMFAGCELEESPLPCDIADSMVLKERRDSLLIRPDSAWPHRFRLQRSHPFDPEDMALAKNFVDALGEKLIAADEPFFSYLFDKCPQDVVAASVQHRLMDDNLLPSVLSTLLKWASQTYEGLRISVAIGVDPFPKPLNISSVHLNRLIDHEFAKVISNGMDTLLVVSPSGHLVEHLALSDKGLYGENISDASFVPNRYIPLAQWARGNRVVVALNRHGEILVFNKQQLKFAFRRGSWAHFSHRAMIARMAKSISLKEVTRAVYASCLDVSFRRTGGCIAIATDNGDSLSKYVDRRDLLLEPGTDKSAILRHLIGQRFPEIPRQIREELLALDGAVILDRRGTVLSAGAIVRVGGGSEGGGRRAAAKALSRLGLSIKISTDGGITAFSDRGTSTKPEVAFEVCA